MALLHRRSKTLNYDWDTLSRSFQTLTRVKQCNQFGHDLESRFHVLSPLGFVFLVAFSAERKRILTHIHDSADVWRIRSERANEHIARHRFPCLVRCRCDGSLFEKSCSFFALLLKQLSSLQRCHGRRGLFLLRHRLFIIIAPPLDVE